MPDNSDKPTTAHQDPSSEKGWAVLVSKVRLWREMAQGSVILFTLAVGVAAIGWTMWAGGEFASPLAVFQSRSRDQVTDLPDAAVSQEEPAARRALDGKRLDGPHSGDYVAVMIDNMSPARPSSGLSQAVFVIEAPVESAITRLQAFFDPADEVEQIGPVRSVRPYYIDWATEADAMLVHVGGSPAALEILAEGDLRDLNEFFNGISFWRDRGRYAPHNTYTSTEKLRAAIARKYADRSLHPVAPWLFKDDVAHAGTTVVAEVPDEERPVLHVSYDASAYDVDWVYDAAKNEYLREQGGKPQKDGETQLRAKNVAVQFVVTKVLDEIGRRSVVTEGSGDAIVALDGRIVEGKWETSGGRTRFLGPDGDEIVFNAGTTWVQVVPDGNEVTHERFD